MCVTCFVLWVSGRAISVLTRPISSAPAAGSSHQTHASTYMSHFQDTQLSPQVEYNWNSSFSSDYEDLEFADGLTETCSYDMYS